MNATTAETGEVVFDRNHSGALLNGALDRARRFAVGAACVLGHAEVRRIVDALAARDFDQIRDITDELGPSADEHAELQSLQRALFLLLRTFVQYRELRSW